MSEQHTPSDGHLGPGPDMIPPPSRPGQPGPGGDLRESRQQQPQSSAESWHCQQVPSQATSIPHQGPARIGSRRGAGGVVLIITLATLLVAGGGFGIWWFWFRGRDGSSTQQFVEGLQQEPTVAWERDISEMTSVAGVSDGLIVAPDLSRGETDMVMLDWGNGERKWSVDLGSEVGEASYIYFEKNLPGGLVGLIVMNGEQDRTMFVHRISDGEQVKRINLGNGLLIPSSSEALYLFETIDSSEGSGRISRIESLENFDKREWTVDAEIGAGDVMLTAVEKNGHVNICWVDQFGDPERCPLSLSLEDGSRPSWYENSLVSYEIDDVTITSDSMGGVAAYDRQGQKLWERTGAGESLKFIGQMVLTSRDGEATVERLDPGSGQVMWTAEWGTGDPTGFLQDGRIVVIFSDQNLRAGVVDAGTGKMDLVDYPFENPRSFFRATDGRLIVQDGTTGEERVNVAAIKPGESGVRWAKSFEGYTHVEQYDRKLVLRGLRTLAVLD